ncbi:hypothetical protein [Leptolyngbya sp. FACHB-261]|uniref:hypothetical protein n=1 Tax=Leptolyngbya sp. FACHB-261 TaxID=2692806 RepID=UPI0016876561|nr:hypothetical protein [Leptolyngbya sp. FACHB-261]MBD2103567.1 hypothetical protein [Leptolyngbya sp. FACHB-261]
MDQSVLTWLGSRSVIGALLLTANAAVAAELAMPQSSAPAPQPAVVPAASRPPVLEVQLAEQAPEYRLLEFTEEESNASIAKFGCDCPAHLNALRQLRGQPSLYQ